MTANLHHHDGGPCPVAPDTPIRPVYRGSANNARCPRISYAIAARLDWSHDGGPDDIVGYYVGLDSVVTRGPLV